MSLRLLVAISGHGLGHLAQVAAVLNTLHRELPGLQLILRTPLSRERLATRLVTPFEWQQATDDFGMVQHDALEVDVPASMARYRALHSAWPESVAQVAAELEDVGADLVLADVPYLTLAAANRAGIPAVAMCCLNWLDIFRHYSSGEAMADTILAQMRVAYNAAALFLRTEPAMPMPELGNVRDIGVVAEPACCRRAALVADGRVKAGEKLLLIAMGGFAHRLPLEQWPQRAGVRYVVPRAWAIQRADCLNIEDVGLSFSELLASCDAVLTKPGYGTFTEAAVNGIPVLYVRRDNWPEEPYLISWLAQHGHCREVTRQQLLHGDMVEVLQALPRPGGYPAVKAEGVRMAVDAIVSLLHANSGGNTCQGDG